MKRIFVYSLILCALTISTVNAQLKIGYVDSKSIIDQLPDAQDIQKRLDALLQEWKDELKKMQNDLKAKEDDFEKRKLILSSTKKKELQKNIQDQNDQISDYKKSKFGVNGEIYKKQNELMKPIQNKVFNAIQKVAEDEEFDYIFDRSGDMMFLYAKPEHDVTYLVLEELKREI